MNSVTEKIDERILRLLGLQDVFDIDYDTYYTLIREAMVAGAKKLPEEELAILANERKRIRGKKGRFKPKTEKPKLKSKVSTAKLLKPSKKVLALPPAKVAPTEEEQKGTGFFGIRKTLDSILQTLTSKFKFDQKQADQERKKEETSKRGKRESTLEGFKKGVAGIVATTKKLLSPFQSIIDRIKRFIFFTLLGRAFTKFMDWLSDKENQKKFDSLIEFLSDHFPAIAGLYILFGTSFGKLVRGLIKGAVRMVIALGMNIPKIAAFIRKNKKLVGLGLGLASLGSGYISREVGNLFGDKETPESKLIPTSNPDLDQAKKSADQAKNTEISTLNFGGMIPKFNFGGIVPSFKMGGMNAFPGMDVQSGIPITGAGKDDTLIAAKTGEAILTEKDQADLSQRYVDRTTGQPLNIPQYLSGRKPGSIAMSNLRFPGFSGGFFQGGMIPKFNTGGMIGAGNLRKLPGRVSPTRSLSPFEMVFQNAQNRLLNKQAERNTQIYNPFAELFRKPSWSERFPIRAPERNYNMPGYDRQRWSELKNLRNFPPNMRRPNETLSLQGGGLVQNVGNWFGNLFNSRRSKPDQSRAPSRPKILEEYQTPEAQALLNTIRSAEHYRGSNPYQAIYGGKNVPFLTQMTVKEAIDMGNTGKLPMRFGGKSAGYGSGSAATGAYQFMPFTLQDLIRRGVVKPNQLMTPALQDKLGWELAKNRGVNLQSLRKTGLNQSIMDMMAPEWASFPYSLSGGKSYYGQPVKGSDFLRQIYSESLNQNKPTKKQGGGSVKENTGKNIKGATADRQLTALQPGEYVIPVDTVNRVGTSFFDKLVAMTDSNSNPYLGRGITKRPQITPYKSMGSNSGTITLPPISQSAGGVLPKSSGGSSVPGFSARHPNGMHYKYAEIYGIAG